jgi:hypothetical protein
MSAGPLYSRSTFWHYIVGTSIGLTVLILGRYLEPPVFGPRRSAFEVSAESREGTWRAVQTWASSIRSGDSGLYRGFYADRLSRFYGHADVPADEPLQLMINEVQKYPTRELAVSNPSFQPIDKDVVQIDFDKSYRFSGPGVRLNQGHVKSSLRFTWSAVGTWKITAEFDRKICWSTLMRDPIMQSPPGTCR